MRHTFRKKVRKQDREKTRAEIEPVLKSVFSRIGKPIVHPFQPDPFQVKAVEAIAQTDCLVIAPTGSGKTWIAEQAILSVFNRGGRCWYASPLKALTNAKWVEFGLHFEPHNVGILTGDTKENPDAPIIVGTTEILRNQLYDAMHKGGHLHYDLVVLDEAHFLGDCDRGVVWEEVMIYLPSRINLLLLSATIGNGDEIARWLSSIRGKECVLIKEEKRPVPLYPLFYHPSGRIMPYLEKRRLYGKIYEYINESKKKVLRRRMRAPRYADLIKSLEEHNLLPAIFFLKSRAECDAALKECSSSSESLSNEFIYTLEELLSRFPYLKHHRHLSSLMKARVASHHAGHLPAWKFLVESMMKKGLLKAIFATSTVAAGVNFPARTIVLFNSDIYDGHAFHPLKGTEFHQMAGRAGRRGQDNIGFMLVVPGRFMDLEHIGHLLFKKPEDILSQIRNDFSMVLNLLLSHTPEDIKDMFDHSFASFQYTHRKKKDRPPSYGRTLWDDFLRHLNFLKEEGFVDDENRLTESGLWASKLRLDRPLLIAECIRQGAFPDDEKLFAALIAPFVYDGDLDIDLHHKKIPSILKEWYGRIRTTLSPLLTRMKKAGFPVAPLYLWTCAVVYDWARGDDWDEIVQRTGIADGDLVMLILRTADNLRQIVSLKETHPEMAELAARARERILREPVIYD